MRMYSGENKIDSLEGGGGIICLSPPPTSPRLSHTLPPFNLIDFTVCSALRRCAVRI